jgi:phosphatidylinositol alpha-1,6-mannosyltransferase
VSRTLVMTNDFPTRQGGIESFVRTLAGSLPPDDVVVLTAQMSDDDAAYDAGLPFRVLRHPVRTLLPSRAVARAATEAIRTYRCDRVLFGAAAPLGLLAPALREAGARRLVAVTHGHECWWARVPGTRLALRRIGDSTDVLTYLGSYTRSVIAPALSPSAAARMERLAPGVDPAVFHPGSGGAAVRRRYDIAADAPVVVSVGRLIARKGQDLLVLAFRQVAATMPEARLLLVGGGKDGAKLARLATGLGIGPKVVLTGPVPWAETPAYFDAGNVFAMPCRTRLGGLEPEALGIVFLEAQSTGLPVLVGRSGGAPDAVRDGDTGYVVDPRDPESIADKLIDLLRAPDRARAMGAAGRAWVQESWTWDQVGQRLRQLLD